MYVRSPRASAWRDSGSTPSTPTTPAAAPRAAAPRVLFAHRPFEARLGRCIALKAVSTAQGERLFVLVVPRHSADQSPRWMAAEQVLDERDAAAWRRSGFAA